jgi:hypothetical protein
MMDKLGTSLIDTSDVQMQTFHDLTLIWLKANIDPSILSAEDLYLEYRKVYDRIVAADEAARKRPGIATW